MINVGIIGCGFVGGALLSFETESVIETSVVDDTISPSYGVLKLSKTIVVTFDFAEKAEIITKFTVIR